MLEGGLMAGASAPQQVANLVFGQTERLNCLTERCGGMGARPFLGGGGLLGTTRLGEEPRGSIQIRAGPGGVTGEDLTDPFAGDTEQVADLLEGGSEGVQVRAAAGAEVLAFRTGQDGVEVSGFTGRDDSELLILRHPHKAQHVSVRDAERSLGHPPVEAALCAAPGAKSTTQGTSDRGSPARHHVLDRRRR